MKRTKVTLLMLILMISSASFAQKMSLCEAFLKIVDASNNSFADIKKDVVDPSKLIKVYGSGIEIAEANKTELKVVLTDPDFTASYGTFNSETEAKAKIQELTDKFGVCYPTVKFCNYY